MFFGKKKERVKEGNDQDMAQSERNSHSKYHSRKNTEKIYI